MQVFCLTKKKQLMTDDDMCISIENHSVKFNKCGTGHSEWEYDTEVQEFSTSLSLFLTVWVWAHIIWIVNWLKAYLCECVWWGTHTHADTNIQEWEYDTIDAITFYLSMQRLTISIINKIRHICVSVWRGHAHTHRCTHSKRKGRIVGGLACVYAFLFYFHRQCIRSCISYTDKIS